MTMKKDKEEIHEFGSCPLRSQRDYGERTASNDFMFSKTIDYILQKLSTFRYGCVYTDGTCLTDMAKIDETDGRDIWIQSPLEFWMRKIGMCHDASVLIDRTMMESKIEHKCYYCFSNLPPYYPTHSFIVALCNDGFRRIVDVFATETCVYQEKFTSYQDASEWRFMKWIDEDNNGSGNAHLLAGWKMPPPKCSFSEFSKNIIETFYEQ